jgi:hypothetical protein
MIYLVQKLIEVLVHGGKSSFLIDLPYLISPQAAKQAAKILP